jgi:hypothetical protein
VLAASAGLGHEPCPCRRRNSATSSLFGGR